LSLPQEKLPGNPSPVQELVREEFSRESIANEQWVVPGLVEPGRAGISGSNRAVWFEVAVVLLICVLPDLYNALRYSGGPAAIPATLVSEQPWLIVRSAGAIALILFIVSKSGETWAHFGIRRLRWRDFLWSVGVFLAGMVGYYAATYTLYFYAISTGVSHAVARNHHAIAPVTGGVAGLPLIILGSLANGMAEELVCRAYLITRFRQLLGSPAVAVCLSASLFCSYHIYQGVWGMTGIFAVGLVYGAMFVWLRRIWPLALGHALQDIRSLMMMTMHR
jgi:membrane protease YdiL (CAAX protease family)